MTDIYEPATPDNLKVGSRIRGTFLDHCGKEGKVILHLPPDPPKTGQASIYIHWDSGEVDDINSPVAWGNYSSFEVLVGGGTTAPTYTDGMSCAACKEHNQWAQPNTPDGKHICYSCRSSGRTV